MLKRATLKECKKGTLVLVPYDVLFSQIQFGQDGPVSFDVGHLQVIQQLLAFSNELHQTLLGGKIFLVLL